MRDQSTRPARVRAARVVFRSLAMLLLACVVVQVFIAGMSVFHDPARWAWHRSFAHVFGMLTLLMLATAFAARLPARTRWLTLGAFALLMLQGVTANVGGLAGALHPVNALVFFWLALVLARGGPEVPRGAG